MESLGIPLGAVVIALLSLGFSLAMWRDHRSLTSRALTRALTAKVHESIEAQEARYQSLRREFATLDSEVTETLERASNKSHRASMRERRAKEREGRLEAVAEQALAPPAPAPTWEQVRQARIRADQGM